ncbi:hypothetical protein TNCV_2031111 [Trichonephila clavipes]|nr:hypothetical protein TNCV_2031111 [Trichonephila clavipes]
MLPFILVTGSRVFSLTCPLGSLGPELMPTLFQPNPRSEAWKKEIMYASSPTPHADTERDVRPREEYLIGAQRDLIYKKRERVECSTRCVLFRVRECFWMVLTIDALDTNGRAGLLSHPNLFL